MAYFLLRFALVLACFDHSGYATRFLPMIVWDHLNPQLSCKCNWLTIPEIDVYDRVDFVCPSLKIAVKLLDGHSRPTSEMNENIFQRKWNSSRNIEDLPDVLNDGSFCDPSQAVQLGTCRNGKEDQSHAVTFKSSSELKKSYKEGDVVVFFNNGDDGRVSTLTSKKVRCSMVFVAKITWLKKRVHDMSYGKCLMPHRNICSNITESCRVDYCKSSETTTAASSMAASATAAGPTTRAVLLTRAILPTTAVLRTRAVSPTRTVSPTTAVPPTTVPPTQSTAEIGAGASQSPGNRNLTYAAQRKPCDKNQLLLGVVIGMAIATAVFSGLALVYFYFKCRKQRVPTVTYSIETHNIDMYKNPPCSPGVPSGGGINNLAFQVSVERDEGDGVAVTDKQERTLKRGSVTNNNERG